ncbi:MAG TPA: hypothetical protein VF133_02980 [Terriglobales bacterium]
MARGWESKSVEQQQEEAKAERTRKTELLTPEQTARRRRLATLELSRKQILHQLETASNPRHRQMLEAALADLNGQIAGTQ